MVSNRPDLSFREIWAALIEMRPNNSARFSSSKALLQHNDTGAGYYLEAKSCTLFTGRIAMFPDAVSK